MSESGLMAKPEKIMGPDKCSECKYQFTCIIYLENMS